MAGEHGAVGRTLLGKGGDQAADDRPGLRFVAAEGGPAQFGRLNDGHDDVSFRVDFPQAADLGGHVLDVKMPVAPGGRPATQGLFERVAVRRRINNQQPALAGQPRRGDDEPADAALQADPADLFVERFGFLEILKERLRQGRGGDGKEQEQKGNVVSHGHETSRVRKASYSEACLQSR